MVEKNINAKVSNCKNISSSYKKKYNQQPSDRGIKTPLLSNHWYGYFVGSFFILPL